MHTCTYIRKYIHTYNTSLFQEREAALREAEELLEKTKERIRQLDKHTEHTTNKLHQVSETLYCL